MSQRFPTDGWYGGDGRPFRFEGEILELEYDGEIPAALNGALYRCGPDRQFAPFAGDVWPAVSGDGMVSMFHIYDGHVDFRSRYVQTDRWKAERKARRALFGSYRNPFTDDPSVAGIDRTVANTSLMWYDQRLFALKEDGLPHEIHPTTLATLGKFDFDGCLRSPTFTAHPKFDPDTGEMLFYGYEVYGLASPEMVLGVAAPDGRLLREEEFTPPYGCMIHDFAVTSQHIIFQILPTTADIERMKQGGPHWAWNPGKPSYLGVMRRDASVETLRWFKGPSLFSWHTMNAFDEGDRVIFDTTVARFNRYFPGEASPDDPDAGAFYPTRLTCDLASNSDEFSAERLLDLESDFYGCDPRFAGKSYRYGYLAARRPDRPAGVGYDMIVALDHRTRGTKQWWAGPGALVGEPVFAPAGPDAVEGEGYLLVIVTRLQEKISQLVVLELLDLEKGPIATIHLPVRLPGTVHGLFVHADELTSALQRDAIGRRY